MYLWYVRTIEIKFFFLSLICRRKSLKLSKLQHNSQQIQKCVHIQRSYRFHVIHKLNSKQATKYFNSFPRCIVLLFCLLDKYTHARVLSIFRARVTETMSSSKAILLLLLLNLFTSRCTSSSSALLRNQKLRHTSGQKTELQDKKPLLEGTAEIEKTREIFLRKVEDAYYVDNGNDGGGDQDYDDYVKRFNNYVSSNANAGYHTNPDSWTTDEWLVFALVLFLFGTIFCIGCVFCIVPCCCPMVGKSYVRMY